MDRKLTLRLLFPLLISAACAVHAENSQNVITSKSTIDWSKTLFLSEVNLNTEKAGIPMPSGKKAALTTIEKVLPDLIRDPFLSLNVNSDQQLYDFVLDETITLEQLTQIISDGKKSPGIFSNGTLSLKTIHSINLNSVSALMIKHRFPYKNTRPIETVPSRVYTGIIIDARGKLNVHAEFVKDTVYPCFFPKVWDEEMNLIYERNMGNPKMQIERGMIQYDWSDDEKRYADRVGHDPLRIRARKVYGQIRTDPVISCEDALKILTVPENVQLLQDGKVVILLDKERLVYPITVPEKSPEYYAAFKEIKEYFKDDEDPPVIREVYDNIQILYDLKFVADSAQLLDSEYPKLTNLAELLKKMNENNSFTILVEGHTADVNKPQGQMDLSIARAQTIIQALVDNGLDKSIFSYRGYGGTQPIATNETSEGRAKNRRVVITARPKATYIQRY